MLVQPMQSVKGINNNESCLEALHEFIFFFWGGRGSFELPFFRDVVLLESII